MGFPSSERGLDSLRPRCLESAVQPESHFLTDEMSKVTLAGSDG